MKLKNFYTLFVLIALAIVFQSRSAGPGSVADLQVTGAPGSSGDMGTCANSGCHTSGSFDPSLALSLDPGDFIPTTVYVPGQVYFLNLVFTTSGGQSGTGFQAVALDGSDAQAGTWSTLPSGSQMASIGGRDYWEHSALNSSLTWDAQWTAPEAGTGDVTFYVAGLASDGNGNTQGDGVIASTITMTEMPPNAVALLNRDFAVMSLAPNPVADRTLLTVSSKSSGTFQLNVMNTAGQRVHSEQLNLQEGQNEKNLRLGDLQSGLYFLQVVGDDQMSTQQLIKL